MTDAETIARGEAQNAARLSAALDRIFGAPIPGPIPSGDSVQKTRRAPDRRGPRKTEANDERD